MQPEMAFLSMFRLTISKAMPFRQDLGQQGAPDGGLAPA